MPGKVATHEEWRAARLALLAKEKEHSRVGDAIKAERQALPMVLVEKDYTFSGPDGEVTLKDLFGTKSQLVIYHFMFQPTGQEGCNGCAFIAANFPDLRHLADKDTALAVVSRAPIDRITPYREKNGWAFPWVSSHGNSFNYDFHATLDEAVAPIEYDYMSKAELEAAGLQRSTSGEQPALSVFKLEEGKVYHTYSSYHRLDMLAATYAYLDLTPAGRQDGPMGPAEFKTPAQYAEAGRNGN